MARPYGPHAAFVAPARRYADLWRIVLGYLIIEIAWFIAANTLTYFPQEPQPRLTALTALYSFLAITLTTFWVVKNLQHRSPLTLFGPEAEVLPAMVRTTGAVLLLFTVITLIPVWDWEGASLARAPVSWALLLPLALPALLIQTSAEEIMFRGFLQQSLGARFRSPLIWMGLPSILFGLSHYDPYAPFGLTLEHMIWAAVFGLAAADLTARTGGLGAAIGLHLGTNLLSVLVFSGPEPFSGLALISFEDPAYDDPWATEFSAVRLAFEILHLWMTWMACRIALRV